MTMKVVDKPWGREDWLVVGDRIAMKRLVVFAGKRFSLQYHEQKEEAWLFVRGSALITIGETKQVSKAGDVIHLRPRTIHRVEAIDETEFIEVSTPELDDVVRLADDFGRPERD